MSIKVSGGGGGGGIPGVTSDGANGEIVAGGLAAGDSGATLVPSFHNFYGSAAFLNTVGNEVDGDNTVQIGQGSPLAANSNAVPLSVSRSGALNGHKYLFGVAFLSDNTGQSDGLLLQATSRVTPGNPGNDAIAFQMGSQGGIALFGKSTVPTAPRTLPQATITAITDANAKAAVQALANALSDMGALTLT